MGLFTGDFTATVQKRRGPGWLNELGSCRGPGWLNELGSCRGPGWLNELGSCRAQVAQ